MISRTRISNTKIALLVFGAIPTVLGSILFGTSFSTTKVNTVVPQTNQPAIANVPSPNKSHSMIIGSFLMFAGISTFSVGAMMEEEEEFLEQPTVLQSSPRTEQPTVLEAAPPRLAPTPKTEQPTVLEAAPQLEKSIISNHPTIPDYDLWDDEYEEENPKYLDFLYENLIIVLGSERGSGKTGIAAWLIKGFIETFGAKVVYCSSIIHSGQFLGIEKARGKRKSLGNGRFSSDFSAIEAKIAWFVSEMYARSEKVAEDPNYNPFRDSKLVIVLDEASDYANHVDEELMATFWDVCTQMNRQYNGVAVVCSHGSTLSMLGGGLSGKRGSLNDGAFWLKLEARTCRESESGKIPAETIEVGNIKNSSDWNCKEKVIFPLSERNLKPYDFREAVATHCPQFLPHKKNKETK